MAQFNALNDLSFVVEIETLLFYHPDLADAVSNANNGSTDRRRIPEHLVRPTGIQLNRTGRAGHPPLLLGPPYSCWQHVNDTSILIVSAESRDAIFTRKKAELAEARKAALRDKNDPATWRQYAREFVSPKYMVRDLNPACRDIASILGALDGHTIFAHATSRCGLHIHVGLTNDQHMDLAAMQCLAFACIVYEEAIDKLHPDHRIYKYHCQSNRLSFRGGPSDVGKYANKKACLSHGYQRKYDWSRMAGVKDIRERIFATTSLTELHDLLTEDKHYRVNFTYIDNPNLPRTVEFRLHKGTVDPVEIRHWIQVCVAMIRWAYRVAPDADRCLPKIKSWNPNKITLAGLFDQIRLPEETHEYYMRMVRPTRDAGRARRRIRRRRGV